MISKNSIEFRFPFIWDTLYNQMFNVACFRFPLVLYICSLQINEVAQQGCHSGFKKMFCNFLFPECPYHGPTHRPCLSDCLNITASCSAAYQNITGQPWPFDCSGLSDSERDPDGYCLGGARGIGLVICSRLFPPAVIAQTKTLNFKLIQALKFGWCLRY